MNRAPLLFRSLTLAAEKMEQAAWTQLVFASSDPKRAAQAKSEFQLAEKEIAEWKSVVQKQIKRKEEGKQIDPSKLWMNG